MQFKLDNALIDDILFCMENQEGVYFIDTLENEIVNQEFDILEEDEGNDRYIDLPEWTTNDGFRLMERFTAGLKNAVVRNELSQALNRGKGVFRSFKNVLGRYPEIEKLWFTYKDKEMKDEVIDWYNALRQEWGLEQIGSEPEDTSSLILEDFIFRAGKVDDAAKTTELHKLCVDAEGHSYAMYNPYEFQPELSLVVETKSGDFAGYISGSKKDDTLHICTLEVVPEYRGLGLGKTLLARFLEKNESHPFSRISIDVPANIEAFAKTLRMEGFEACSCRFVKSFTGIINDPSIKD